jgi:hypothetical protein
MMMMMDQQLKPKKPKWRWLLLPLLPIAVPIGIITALIWGFPGKEYLPEKRRPR